MASEDDYGQAKIKTLLDPTSSSIDPHYIYPVTKAKAVYLSDNATTVEEKLTATAGTGTLDSTNTSNGQVRWVKIGNIVIVYAIGIVFTSTGISAGSNAVIARGIPTIDATLLKTTSVDFPVTARGSAGSASGSNIITTALGVRSNTIVKFGGVSQPTSGVSYTGIVVYPCTS